MAFHVPDQYRIRRELLPKGSPLLKYASDERMGNSGAFQIPNPFTNKSFMVLASADYGWDHVSVSTPNRCPTWDEMCYVKNLFWDAEDTVMQLHVPTSDHVNNHQFTLHMWRPQVVEIPRPPKEMV